MKTISKSQRNPDFLLTIYSRNGMMTFNSSLRDKIGVTSGDGIVFFKMEDKKIGFSIVSFSVFGSHKEVLITREYWSNGAISVTNMKSAEAVYKSFNLIMRTQTGSQRFRVSVNKETHEHPTFGKLNVHVIEEFVK